MSKYSLSSAILVSLLMSAGVTGTSVLAAEDKGAEAETAPQESPAATTEPCAERRYPRHAGPLSHRHQARIATVEARRRALDAEAAARRWWMNPDAEYRRQWRDSWRDFDRQAAEDRSNRMREWAAQRWDQMYNYEPAGPWGHPGYGFGGYPSGGYAPYGYGGYPWW